MLFNQPASTRRLCRFDLVGAYFSRNSSFSRDKLYGNYVEDGFAVEVYIEDKAIELHYPLKRLNLFVGVDHGTNLFILLVSKDDRALAASSFLDADHPRVGRLDIDDPQIRETAVKYGIKVVDITSVKGTDGLGHDRFVSLAKLYPQLASLDGSVGRRSPAQVGAFIFDTAGATVASPFRLVSKVVSPQ